MTIRCSIAVGRNDLGRFMDLLHTFSKPYIEHNGPNMSRTAYFFNVRLLEEEMTFLKLSIPLLDILIYNPQ